MEAFEKVSLICEQSAELSSKLADLAMPRTNQTAQISSSSQLNLNSPINSQEISRNPRILLIHCTSYLLL